jgi:hypothetical protein
MTRAAGLDAGLAALGLDLPADARRRLLAYLGLLAKWNRTYNLTAIRDENEMLTHHLLDSLAVLPVLEKSALAGRRWIDVGSGAGLPGIPLAIACPELKLTLVDTVDKKTRLPAPGENRTGAGQCRGRRGPGRGPCPAAALMPRSRAPLLNWRISFGSPAICLRPGAPCMR